MSSHVRSSIFFLCTYSVFFDIYIFRLGDISVSGTHVAVGSIGSITLLTDLNDMFMSPANVENAINNLVPDATASRNTAMAITLALASMQQNGRPDVPQMIVILTTGESDGPLQTKQIAAITVQSGIDIIAVGVGSNLDQTELNYLAGSPNRQPIIAQTYEELATLSIHDEFCQGMSGDKNISILHLSCRTSDLQFSLVLQTHALVL